MYLRISGTHAFISVIDANDTACYPPGRVEIVEGWKHPDRLEFDNENAASLAAEIVARISGLHCEIEE